VEKLSGSFASLQYIHYSHILIHRYIIHVFLIHTLFIYFNTYSIHIFLIYKLFLYFYTYNIHVSTWEGEGRREEVEGKEREREGVGCPTKLVSFLYNQN
jgi:hypothetical protein